MTERILFIVGLIFAASPWASPPEALIVGILFALCFSHPYRSFSHTCSRTLLQICVIGLGFGVNLNEVARAGKSGFLAALMGILLTLSVGMLLGHVLKIGRTSAYLVSVGTAICGASAIAAVAPVIDASEEETSVSLGTVFILNSLALLIFPYVGEHLQLTQAQFGMWAALAIHDTSSVVGASAKYGAEALVIGTTVKLARALWIVPLTIATAALSKRQAKIIWPWFIGLFVVAAIVNTYFPAGQQFYAALVRCARAGLTITLFLIGSNLSKSMLVKVGVRPFIQGTLLWLIVAALSLLLIRSSLV